jgi:cytochrome P450
MVLYPEAQRRAQEEIDSVLGHGHLPHFGDADALPYLKAMVHELLRWACPAPLGRRNPWRLLSFNPLMRGRRSY